MAETGIKIMKVGEWIEDNKDSFVPPVCNKLMHTGGQIDVMFVGGPNSRKDYHIEGGEELFYQVRGDMLLKVVERGRHKDIIIKQGEMFLLPRAIPHSPQRFANTVGLVLERRRHDMELDGLRYFTERDGELQTETLYETWFSWGKQSMPELFQQYFSSEQHKTGKPIPDTILKDPPICVDSETRLHDPFSLKSWIQDHHKQIDSEGRLPVFDTKKHQMQVYICGKGSSTFYDDYAEMWIWQMNGESRVENIRGEIKLGEDDSALIPVGLRFILTQKEGSIALVCYQDPRKSSQYPDR